MTRSPPVCSGTRRTFRRPTRPTPPVGSPSAEHSVGEVWHSKQACVTCSQNSVIMQAQADPRGTRALIVCHSRERCWLHLVAHVVCLQLEMDHDTIRYAKAQYDMIGTQPV